MLVKLWGCICVFPKIVVPPNHPICSWGVPLFSPSILGTPIFGNTHITGLYNPLYKPNDQGQLVTAQL